MSGERLIHGDFTLERRFETAPERLFAAWVDPALKARWFGGPPERWTELERRLAPRPGGEEILRGRFDAAETLYRARYHLIEPPARLIYAYEMFLDGAPLSVSLASVVLVEASGGTALLYTEQAALLPGGEGLAARRRGTEAQLDRLDALLRAPAG